MIISRTPLRISFFGGGTDYPSWFNIKSGAVISTTIDKYIYISCRYFPPFFKYNINITYSQIENCKKVDEINHPSVKACLQHLKIKSNIEINHNSDLPGKSGLGSSSSFTVGLLNALYGYKSKMISKQKLAEEAVYVEHNLIKENVGVQDQFAASYGGLNLYEFRKYGVETTKIILPQYRLNELKYYLLLFHTGLTRFASNVAKHQIDNTNANGEALSKIYMSVFEAIDLLNDNGPIERFGKLLHSNWELKKSLSSKISNDYIDNLYQIAIMNGAIGGKLLGAGAGGCMLIFADPKNHNKIKAALSDLINIPFEFDTEGSKIIFNS